MVERFGVEMQAYAMFTELMKSAEQCRVLFERARIPLPLPLKRFLGDGVDATGTAKPQMLIPPLEAPDRPTDAQQDWIWLSVQDVAPMTLVRAIVRAAEAPLGPTEISSLAASMGRTVSRAVIANIGTRLAEDQEITREAGAWSKGASVRPVTLHQNLVWGPVDAFDKHDIAKHRRMCILHILQMQPDGLQTVQLTRTLELCDWVRAPKTKDLVKMDLVELGKVGAVRRIGNSGKWKAVE